jgi:hypothetical protein
MTRTLIFLDESPDPKGRKHRAEISANPTPDGGLKIDGVYQGAMVEEYWGDWDHEFGLTLPPEAMATALTAVMRHGFQSGAEPLTWTRLIEILKEAGITPDLWSHT